MKTHALPIICQRFALLLAACTALGLGAPSAQAEVLIYKGITRATADVTNPFPRTFLIFHVIDLDASTLGAAAGLVVGDKKVQSVSGASEFRITQAPLTKGQTATTISLTVTSGASNDFFSNTAFHYRGKNATLKTKGTVGGGPVLFPRLFVGFSTQDQAFNGQGSFVEQKAVLSYQEARTKAANDAGQTIQQVLDALGVELEAKGFEPIP